MVANRSSPKHRGVRIGPVGYSLRLRHVLKAGNTGQVGDHRPGCCRFMQKRPITDIALATRPPNSRSLP